MYDTIGPYRTLPYSRSHSPFITPMVPLVRPPRQGGYVTIPRRPRQSWSSEPPVSDIGEPLYDNLGVRTTATGSTMQNLNKLGETPKGNRTHTDETTPVMATLPRITPAQRALSPTWTPNNPGEANRRDSTVSLPTPDGRIKKVPPAPPPKPNKRASTRPLFEDEGEDGTEVWEWLKLVLPALVTQWEWC